MNIEKIFMRRNMRRLLFNASDNFLIRQNFGKSYGMCQIKSETKRQNKKKTQTRAVLVFAIERKNNVNPCL